MSVPGFGDLGKCAKDLFEKNYKYGLLNFDFKSKSANDVDIHFNGTHNASSNALASFLEFKMKPHSGITVNTKLSSHWVVTTDVELKGNLHPQLKHNLISTLETESGRKSLTSKNNFTHDMVNLGMDLDFKAKYPVATSSLVFCPLKCKTYSIGAQAVVDSEQMKINKHVFAFQYRIQDFHGYAALTNLSNVDCSVFHQKDNLDVGFKIGWNKDSRDTSYGAGFMYKPSDDTFIKMKYDQNSILGFAYGIKTNPDLIMTLCAEVDAKNMNSGGNKFGFSVEYGS